MGKRPAGSFPFSFLSAKRKHWKPNHIANCIPHSLFLATTAPGKTNTFFLRSFPPGGPTEEPSGRADPLLCSRIVFGCIPSLAPSCQPASCHRPLHRADVLLEKASGLYRSYINFIFLPGCFRCNMCHISLLTCLVRNCSAFSWCAE